MNVRSQSLVVTFIASVCLATSAHSQIKASPLASRSPQQQFPRVSGLGTKSIQDQVNAVLAKRERQDLDRRKECLASDMPGAPEPTYDETIRTVYLSPYLLSIDVRASWTGCSANPNIDMAEPLTIDLRSGKVFDWNSFFTGRFIDSSDGNSSPLTKLYLSYAQLSAGCSDTVNKPLTEYILWLDSQNGLMLKPALPHATQACAKLVTIPFSDIKDQVNPVLRRDLLASMRPAHE